MQKIIVYVRSLLRKMKRNSRRFEWGLRERSTEKIFGGA